IGKRRTSNGVPKAHVVELRGLRRQTGLDVAQTLPKSQLGECHGTILFRARERPHAVVATVALHQARERAPRQNVHKLGEQRLANVHAHPPRKPQESAPSLFKSTPPQKCSKSLANPMLRSRSLIA